MPSAIDTYTTETSLVEDVKDAAPEGAVSCAETPIFVQSARCDPAAAIAALAAARRVAEMLRALAGKRPGAWRTRIAPVLRKMADRLDRLTGAGMAAIGKEPEDTAPDAEHARAELVMTALHNLLDLISLRLSSIDDRAAPGPEAFEPAQSAIWELRARTREAIDPRFGT